MTINRRLLMLATASAIALAGMVLPAAAQDSTLLTSTAADRDAKLAEAAKAEGSLMLYTSIAQKDVDPLVRPFEEKYGIKVTRVAGERRRRSATRRAGSRRPAAQRVDLIHISAPEMEGAATRRHLPEVRLAAFCRAAARRRAGAQRMGEHAALRLGPGLQHRPYH
jgi:iron(III) transport system substrate-binding protein